jgi:sporulation protein YlmC with PRC-barrel domain
VRLSELLDCDVVDEHGARAGRVHDVRLAQDGPVGAGFDAALRVQGLVVGRAGVASRLGYGRSGNERPWLVRTVLMGRHRPSFVPWSRVRSIDAGRIVIAGRADDLEPVRTIPDAKRGESP